MILAGLIKRNASWATRHTRDLNRVRRSMKAYKRKPSPSHSLDRKDGASPLGYCKENCRWASKAEQAQNTRRSRWWHIDGLVFPSAQVAAEHFGVSCSKVVYWCNKAKHRDGCWSELKYPPS